MRFWLGILLGVLLVSLGIFLIALPYSMFFLIVTVNELMGVPCGGLC